MKYTILFLGVLTVCLTGCTKYLDAVPDKSLTVPTTVADYQVLMNNEKIFAYAPALGEFGSDDLYLPDALWAAQPQFFRDAYVWSKVLDEGNTSPNWDYAYAKIYNSNIVLDGVGRLTGSATDINQLKGWALFCRANAFYDLQEVYGQPYRPASANTDLGIPLKLTTNLQEKASRATVAATFQQIVNDLNEAVLLLPAEVSKVNRSEPGKAAAYALLARVYLIMQDYNQALLAGNNCLKLYNVLVDYNTLNASSRAPFSPLIDEVIYNAVQLNNGDRSWQVDQQLYQSFAANDLRKVLLFTPDANTHTAVFKGFYSALFVGFDGLATDEMYLIIVECEARAGNNDSALATLNSLLIKRFKTGAYVPYTTANTSDVIDLVLTERRKECIFRNLRWSDLRRLNQDPRFAKTLVRTVNGQNYELLPNDSKYTMPIPDDEIRLSGLQQNLR